jgi:OH-DDVA meta-cleavage compound hydrolase
MLIDCHGHLSAPAQLWLYQGAMLAHRGAHGRGKVAATDEEIRAAYEKKEMGPHGHLGCLAENQIDVQLLSPRPFRSMHSEKPGKLVHWWTAAVNDMIARSCEVFPDRFIGVGGLPQECGEPIEVVFDEFDRGLKYGFKGFILNPDPHENGGEKAPAMGDKYWYPLYEKACKHDVVLHVHPTASRNPDREPYTLHFINEQTTAVYGLCNSSVFEDFPELKVLCSHGGGAIPYQLGRFDSQSMRKPKEGRFHDWMKKLYFDSVLYSQDALELLIKTVGVDRVLFGAECPGVGSNINPDTGLTFDNIKPSLDAIEWLSEDDYADIYKNNAVKVFNLDL